MGQTGERTGTLVWGRLYWELSVMEEPKADAVGREGANAMVGARKKYPREFSGEGSVALLKWVRAFLGEGLACVEGLSLTLGL